MSHDDHDRDDVADALRARQSLDGDVHPGDEDFNAQTLGSGMRFATSTEGETEAEEVLDDEEVDVQGDEA